MEKNNIFLKSEVSFANLNTLSQKQADGFELRICEFSFIADEILSSAKKLADDGMSITEILSLLSEELGITAAAVPENAMPQSRSSIKGFLSNLNTLDKVSLCNLITEKWRGLGRPLSETDFLASESAEPTFAYVKNSLSDEAYEVFSQEFDDPRVSYCQSFKEACHAVAESDVGYCILPLEEKGGARIPGIASMISSFDLKIVAVTPVFGFEGNADVKYALLSRGFFVPERLPDDDLYLEIVLYQDSDVGISELLSVAESLGIGVYRINTVLYESDGTQPAFSVVLRDDGADFTPLLVFLTLFSSSYSSVGFYKNLE